MIKKKVFIFLLFISILGYSKVSDYALNIYNPLVLNGARTTGMGGAVVSLGDEAEDIFYNGAAVSYRNKYQKDEFEWDYSLSFANIFTRENIDYRNAREVFPNYSADALSYFSLALIIMYDRWGFSLSFSQARTDLLVGSDLFTLQEGLVVLNVGYEIILNRLYGSFAFVTPQLEYRNSNDDLIVKYEYLKDTTPNLQIGLIYDFENIPLKLGANALFNINGTKNSKVGTFNIDLPKEIRHPTKITIGASWKFIFHHEKENPKLGGNGFKNKFSFSPHYLLISSDLEIVAPVKNAVDVLSYVDTTKVYRSGKTILYQPRFGLEVLFPTWLKVRAGYYLEGDRIEGTSYRHHLTSNIEFKAFKLFGLTLALGATLDYAKEFWSFGFSVKTWKY